MPDVNNTDAVSRQSQTAGPLVAIKCGAGGGGATSRLDAKSDVARAKITCLSRNPRSGATVQSLLRGRFLGWEKAQLVPENSNETGRGFVYRRCRLNQRDPLIAEVTHRPRGFSSGQELRIAPERCVETLADSLGEQWR